MNATETEVARDEPPTAPGRSRNRIPLVVMILMTLVGMGAVVYNSFASETEEPLDQASHVVVATACRQAFDVLHRFPVLTSAAAGARADLLVRENVVFNRMTDAFTRATPPNHSGAIALGKWIGDWRAVNQRRAQYAHDLRASNKFPELVLPKDDAGAPITNRMNEFSRTHDLVGCETHNLQAETVDGVRDYPNDPTRTA